MRHGRTINQLGRESSHRKALLSNLAISLILHKKVNTTLAKGKELRKYIEPLITKSKNDTTHSRRTVFAYLGSKEAVTELFREIAKRVADRPGGYTRIFKTGNRLGDNAETCLVEFVDFNENYTEGKAKEDKKAKTVRRGRGAGKKKVTDDSTISTEETKIKETKADTAETTETPAEE
jgi:large subunit ribosomal protein L17